jgi:predicted HicB family RNase H-like nuclease
MAMTLRLPENLDRKIMLETIDTKESKNALIVRVLEDYYNEKEK